MMMESLFNFDPQNIFYRCVEGSNEAIMISNNSGVLVYVNPAWERIYKYTKEEAIGQNPRLLHSGMQPPEFYHEMWTRIRNPEIGHWKGELINKAKDGTLVPVILSITPFRDQNREIVGYMGIALDVTYRKELEAKVAHQDRLASIGMLASGLAHEIGTPLGVVRGRAEFLMMQAADPSAKRNLEVITSQIDRISKLIRSLLRVSRSFSDVNISNVRLTTVLEEVLALVGQNLKQDGVDVRIEVPETLEVQADFGRLEQVLLNLVMNSIHAIRKASSGAIAPNAGRKHFLVFSAEQLNGRVVLNVRDSGCGISPENMKKLFKPFFTTKDIGEGTGLGLAIVAQLVREMDGEISARSVLGEGATFSVALNPA